MTPKRTSEERVIARIRSSQRGLKSFKQKTHVLRRLVAGDLSAIGDGPNAKDDAQLEHRPEQDEFYDVLVRDVSEGKSNALLQAIRTLAFQTAYHFPEIEIEDVSHYEQSLMSEYCRVRLGAPPLGCNAIHHFRLALLDYIEGGMGWAWATMRDGLPIIRSVDTLDMNWDQTARMPGDIRWASATLREPGYVWVEKFGKRAFKDLLDFDKDLDLDKPMELEFYYDMEGVEGTHMVLTRTGNNDVDSKPLIKGPSTCMIQVGAARKPFLPFESFFFMTLPSVRLPVGLGEQMLPAHLALLRVEDTIDKIIKRGMGFYDVDANAYDPEQLEAFEEGEIGAVVRRKTGSQPVNPVPPMALPQSVVDWRSHNDQKLTAMGGNNPYASGSVVEGTNYAAEVNAIQGASGLVASTIAKDNAEFVERTVRKFLAVAKEYDDNPITLRIDDVPLEFDALDPIRDYLKPDAMIVVREDSMQYAPKETRIALAEKDLQVALQFAMQYPNAVPLALEAYLRARGEKQITKWLEPPAIDPTMMMAAMQGGGGAPQDGGADPSMGGTGEMGA